MAGEVEWDARSVRVLLITADVSQFIGRTAEVARPEQTDADGQLEHAVGDGRSEGADGGAVVIALFGMLPRVAKNAVDEAAALRELHRCTHACTRARSCKQTNVCTQRNATQRMHVHARTYARTQMNT